jgi:hypothetical protein
MSCRQIWNWQWLQQQWQPSSFLSAMCYGEAFPGLGVQGVKGLILVGVLFVLDGGKKKQITVGKEGFPGARPTLLSVQQVATVRCN